MDEFVFRVEPVGQHNARVCVDLMMQEFRVRHYGVVFTVGTAATSSWLERKHAPLSAEETRGTEEARGDGGS